MTRDPVLPVLALAVFARDQGCVAPRLGGSFMDCWGRDRIEHVKMEPRMGVRAEARMDRLVTLCEGHTEPGMRAGYVWATARENRAAMRAYLAEVSRRCIFVPCVATWRHWHGGLPGGYDNPEDPEGPPIPFTGDDPDPTAVRDYNGAAL